MHEYLLLLYFLRHQESEQNSDGYGEPDTSLTQNGRAGSSKLVKILRSIGPVDEILTGTKKRHVQTLEQIKPKINYEGQIVPEERLNALFGGELMEVPGEVTERKYGLDKFQPGPDGLYHDTSQGKLISFDPVKTGVFPFDPLYSAVYTNKDLRQIVFPNAQLTPFEDIEQKVRSFQQDIINTIRNSKPDPKKIVAIASCSPSGFNLEYAAFNTIGRNMQTPFGREQKRVFPLQHDEIMVLGYTREDLENNRNRLRPIEGNIKIDTYLQS